MSPRAPNTCTWDFPDVIKFRVAVHTISEKAIRFKHPDYDPDRAQKLISSSMSRHLWTRKMSSKSMRAFLSNLANRQTDKHRGQSHLPPPLSEVNNNSNINYHLPYASRAYWRSLSRRSQQRQRLSASMLSICLFVSLSVAKMQKNAIFSQPKQLRAIVAIDDL